MLHIHTRNCVCSEKRLVSCPRWDSNSCHCTFYTSAFTTTVHDIQCTQKHSQSVNHAHALTCHSGLSRSFSQLVLPGVTLINGVILCWYSLDCLLRFCMWNLRQKPMYTIGNPLSAILIHNIQLPKSLASKVWGSGNTKIEPCPIPIFIAGTSTVRCCPQIVFQRCLALLYIVQIS